MVFGSIWRKIFRPLLNERGEVGNVQNSESANQDANLSWDKDQEGSQPSGEATENAEGTEGQEPATSAETLKTEGAEGQEGTEGQQEGAQEESDEVPQAFHKHPAWQRIMKEREDEKARADFYERHFNDRFQAETTQRAGEQEAQPQGQETGKEETPGIDLSKLPQGIKPPNQWETQEDIGKYVNHAVQSLSALPQKVAEAEITKAYKQAILPVFKQISQRLVAMAEEVMKGRFSDFDDMVKEANADIFTMDPAGKILGIKNQALLDYINQDLIPARALYQHGLKKKAPQKIQETRRTTTQNLVKQLNTKPKGPTLPQGGTGGRTPSGALDWNTPRSEVDKTLKKRGLI